jgi:hypothetical protein
MRLPTPRNIIDILYVGIMIKEVHSNAYFVFESNIPLSETPINWIMYSFLLFKG